MLKKTSQPKPFSLPKLIIVEGEDDSQFIYHFLKLLSKDPKINRNLLSQIFIHRTNGKTKLLNGDWKEDEDRENSKKGLVDIVKDTEFIGNCKQVAVKVAVIFDTDQSLENSFKSIMSDFQTINDQEDTPNSKKIFFNLPDFKNSGKVNKTKPNLFNPTVSIFLLPNSQDSGSLEDLYLSTLDKKDRAILKCLEGKEIDKCVPENLSLSHKTKLLTQSFLAAKDKTFKTIGFAASAGKVNFNSPALNPLKKFLIDFSNS